MALFGNLLRVITRESGPRREGAEKAEKKLTQARKTNQQAVDRLMNEVLNLMERKDNESEH